VLLLPAFRGKKRPLEVGGLLRGLSVSGQNTRVESPRTGPPGSASGPSCRWLTSVGEQVSLLIAGANDSGFQGHHQLQHWGTGCTRMRNFKISAKWHAGNVGYIKEIRPGRQDQPELQPVGSKAGDATAATDSCSAWKTGGVLDDQRQKSPPALSPRVWP